MSPLRRIVYSLDRALLRPLRRALNRGTGRECPLCESSVGAFGPFGVVPRPEARCPICGSLERHRLIWLFFLRRTDLLDGKAKKMIHFAPEREIQARLETAPGIEYLTADLDARRAMACVDITAIQFPDESFDVVYCSHVLEHIPDDRLAMRELYRILKSSGWAAIMVPITAERTFEDPSVTDPRERERLFGQVDHVRRYGPDIIDRLREAGFVVERLSAPDVVSAEEARRFGIMDEDIFLCRKAA